MSQGLALLVKIVRKISKYLIDVQKTVIVGELSATNVDPLDVKTQDLSESATLKPCKLSLDDELNMAGDEVNAALREKQREMIDALELEKSVQSVFQPNT